MSTELTEVQYKNLIKVEIGDTTGVVNTNLDTYWTMHSDKLPIRRQYLHTKLACIDLVLGQPAYREAVSYSEDGQSQDLNKLFENLKSMRLLVADEIKNFRSAASKPVAGTMAATAPVSAPYGYPDANSGAYRGDPYNRDGRRL